MPALQIRCGGKPFSRCGPEQDVAFLGVVAVADDEGRSCLALLGLMGAW